MKEIFFGAGKIGRTILELWKLQGKEPLFIVDNNINLWGRKIENIEICNPNRLIELGGEDIVYITCSGKKEIYNQIRNYGIVETNIRILDSWKQFMPQYIENASNILVDRVKEKHSDLGETKKIIFDLENGVVLGGVEAWVFQIAKEMRKEGYITQYLTFKKEEDFLRNELLFTKNICDFEEYSIVKKINLTANYLLQQGKVKIISNFGGIIFWGTCLAKKVNPRMVEHIVVVHSDAPSLYDEYAKMEGLVDNCIIISEKMNIELKKRGFPQNKIKKMIWDIDIESNLKHNYSKDGEPIRIGYAGRITRRIKRLDLFLQVLIALKERRISFICEIAGVGDYLEQLQSEIIQNDMQKEVFLRGYIDRTNIKKFWSRQDIMVSCSEHEGHSISQMEAMAMGVVPVLTDVSGVRDDVLDEINGFIVPVNDTNMIIERICVLDRDRKLLKKMGKEAYYRMAENKKEEQSWKRILGM